MKDLLQKEREDLKNYLLAVHKEYQNRNELPYCKNCGVDHKELAEKIDKLYFRLLLEDTTNVLTTATGEVNVEKYY